MFAFVTMFISLIVISLIMFSTKIQRKTRKTVSDFWCNYNWETLDERPKWPVWLVLMSYVISMVPVLNIVYAILMIVWFIKQYNDEPYSNRGGNIIAERLVFSNSFTNWLTKEI